MKLRLTFNTNQVLDIVPTETEIGHKWFNQIQSTKKKGCIIKEDNRIYNMNKYWTRDKIISEIINCVKIVNTYEPFIDFIDTAETLTQEQLNYLHHHFEMLIGLDHAGSEYYNSAPEHVKQVIRDFNVQIHRMESKIDKRMVVTFNDSKRFELSSDELAMFNFKNVPGDVYFNYCHTGKPLFNFFRDKDTHIDAANILPQHCWKSDFVIGFYNGVHYRPHFKEWSDNCMRIHKNSLPFPYGDSRNAYGYLTVGKVVGDVEQICRDLYGIERIIDYNFQS